MKMSVSDLQTLDFMLKAIDHFTEAQARLNLQFVVKLDNSLWTGDFIEFTDYLYIDTQINPYGQVVKIKSGLDLDERDNSGAKEAVRAIANFSDKAFTERINEPLYKYLEKIQSDEIPDLQVLFMHLMSLKDRIEGVNDLPKYIYNARCLTSSIALPIYSIGAYDEVELVSIIRR